MTREGNKEKEKWEQSVPEAAIIKSIILYANLKTILKASGIEYLSITNGTVSVSSGKGSVSNVFWKILGHSSSVNLCPQNYPQLLKPQVTA